MLHEFLSANRQELINRCGANMAARFDPSAERASVDNGVPLFLQQLETILRHEQSTDERAGSSPAGADPKGARATTDIGRSAALHGTELLRLGFTVDQVVHGYGDICQAVTGLAVERKASFSADEFRTLNRCLDNAIADAVTAFGNGSESSIEARARALPGRLDLIAVEQRRLVDIAINSFTAMKTGTIGFSGATGALLAHALDELRSLPERILSDLRQEDASTAKAPK